MSKLRNILNSLFNFLDRNEKHTLLFLMIFSALIKIVFISIAFSEHGTTKWSDDFLYLNYGQQLSEGNWMFDMITAPVIPLLVATFRLMFLNPIIPFFIYNIIASSLFIIVIFHLAVELFEKRTAWFIAFWGTVFFETIRYSNHITKEDTVILLVPLTLFLLVKHVKLSKEQKPKYLILSVFVFSLLIHTDERFFAYIIFFPFLFMYRNHFRLSGLIRSLSIWLGLLALFMLPWGIRNFLLYEQVVIISPRTTAITSYFWGENIAEGASHFSDERIREISTKERYKNAKVFGNRYGLNPRKFNKCEARLRAFFHFWQPTFYLPTYIQWGFRTAKWSIGHNFASILFYGMFLPFYIAGFFRFLLRKKYFMLTVAAMPIFNSAIHAYMVWPLERYRTPLTFIVVMIGINLIMCFIHTRKKSLVPA